METHFDKNYELQDERLQEVNDKDARGLNFISLNLFESEYEDEEDDSMSIQDLKGWQEDISCQSSPKSQEGNMSSLADFLEPNMVQKLQSFSSEQPFLEASDVILIPVRSVKTDRLPKFEPLSDV